MARLTNLVVNTGTCTPVIATPVELPQTPTLALLIDAYRAYVSIGYRDMYKNLKRKRNPRRCDECGRHFKNYVNWEQHFFCRRSISTKHDYLLTNVQSSSQ